MVRALDLTATVRYHAALSTSGGLSDHSDASYALAYYLEYNGLGAPIVLDWGMGATVRYLSAGAVTPIEIFGYQSLDGTGSWLYAAARYLYAKAGQRLPAARAGAGRLQRPARGFCRARAQAVGREPTLVETFAQRDGTPLYELWRVPAE